MGSVDTSVAREMPFVVTYDCRDTAGNTAVTMRRRVYVVNPCAGVAANGGDEQLCPSDDPATIVCSQEQICPLATNEDEAGAKKEPTIVLKVPSRAT